MDPDHRSPNSIELERVLAPLGDEEAERAIRSAVDAVAERTGRYRVLGAQLAIEKPPGAEQLPDRMIEVLVVDYDNRRSLRVMVGSDGATVGSQVLDYEPPLSVEELGDARQLAERDERLAEPARRNDLVVSSFIPAAAQVGERHIGLRYGLPEQDLVRPVATVEVSLATGEVVRLEQERDQEGGG